MSEQEPVRHRIVSKIDYLVLQTRNASTWSDAAFCFGLSFVLVAAVPLYWYYDIVHGRFSPWDGPVGGVVLGIAASVYSAGMDYVRRALAIDAVIPLTKANLATIPAAESLVRPSDEQAQDHQGVLLRSVTETPDTHDEQLVRPVGKA